MAHRLARLAFSAVVVFAIAAGDWTTVRAEDGVAYLSAVRDLPLMPELREATEDALVFDTPAGRIVEAFAAGVVTRADVVAFYAATLPQLGWVQDAETVFRREGEVLRLDFPAGGATKQAALTVRFALSPAGAGN